MPIYEFYSPDTHRIYSFYARRILREHEIPRCPDGAGYRMEKLVSRVSVLRGAREPSAAGGSGEPDLTPAQEAAMMNLGRELEGIDPDRGDPRQLATLMRKMSGLTGEKMPAPMEEMLARMEKGEDPEKLEAEYGDLLDDPGGADAGDPSASQNLSVGEPGRSQSRSVAAASSKLRRPPERDATLYEASEFLEASSQ